MNMCIAGALLTSVMSHMSWLSSERDDWFLGPLKGETKTPGQATRTVGLPIAFRLVRVVSRECGQSEYAARPSLAREPPTPYLGHCESDQ